MCCEFRDEFEEKGGVVASNILGVSITYLGITAILPFAINLNPARSVLSDLLCQRVGLALGAERVASATFFAGLSFEF